MRGSVEPGHIKKYNHSQKKQTVVTDHCFDQPLTVRFLDGFFMMCRGINFDVRLIGFHFFLRSNLQSDPVR